MRIVIQRVEKASVSINDKVYSSIKKGLLCFVGFCDLDTEEDFLWSLNKLLTLKLFPDTCSLQDLNAQLLVVSQFTLFGSIKKGTKPSWSRAANPELAKDLYDKFIRLCKDKLGDNIEAGVFGADMKIESVNNGPLTLIIDTKNKE
tara:strand:+ start:1035 stop:1472 length:438 start_codon:yes stop_codon:yes gene_type:complete